MEIPLEWNQAESFEVLHAEYNTCWFYFKNLLLANPDFLYSQTVVKMETAIQRHVLKMHVVGTYFRQCTLAECIYSIWEGLIKHWNSVEKGRIWWSCCCFDRAVFSTLHSKRKLSHWTVDVTVQFYASWLSSRLRCLSCQTSMLLAMAAQVKVGNAKLNECRGPPHYNIFLWG